jgi:beta-glucuronidase
MCSPGYDHVTIARLTTLLATVATLLATAGAAGAAAPVPPERTLYTDAPNGMYLLDADWSTRADNESEFRPVAIPNAFNAHDLSAKSFRGRVQWYRARFSAPSVEGVAGWRIRFESVNNDATVWLNGKEIGHHRGAYLPFELAAAPLRAGENELLVRVDSRGSPNDLQPSNRPRGWWNFGGILREVYLRAVRSFDLSELSVSAAPGGPARISGQLRNMTAAPLPGAVQIRVTGPGGFESTTTTDTTVIQPGRTASITARIAIPNAQLWSPRHPALYELTVDAPGGQRATVHFGVCRWSVARTGRIQLNGKPLTMRGASFHEQVPDRGAALTPGDRDEIVRELKAVGANVARTHYPPHPALLEAFDREGIVYWDQIPVWRIRGDQLRNHRYRAMALDAFEQMVRRDRNHASVVAWSVSNETLRGGNAEASYFRAARALLNRLDRTRLLVADQSLLPLSGLPSSYRLLDGIGLNDYVGWYGGRLAQLPGDLAAIHRRFRGKALVISEFGAEANRNGPANQKGTYAFQRHLLSAHLRAYDRAPFVSGALVWVLRDLAIRPGWTGGNPHPRPPILFKGLFTQDGRAKPALATVRRLFRAQG